MARTALELTKVAGTVKTTYLELEHSRDLKELARAGATAPEITGATYTDNLDVRATQIKQLQQMLRLEYQHREAYAKLKATMGQ
jgi:hypothetical protein